MPLLTSHWVGPRLMRCIKRPNPEIWMLLWSCLNTLYQMRRWIIFRFGPRLMKMWFWFLLYAQEVAGLNAIPLGVASVISKCLGIPYDDEIVQAIKVGRTGKDGWYRLANSPIFNGQLKNSASHAILIDDTLTQGGTFANLKGHIESTGGQVIGAYGLTGKQYSKQLRLSPETLNDLRKHYGELEDWWKTAFGHDFRHLSEWEARYILNSGKNADIVRNLIVAAKKT